MRKKTTPKRQAKPASPKPPVIPPLATAVAVMADPQAEGVADQFARAYALMPALVAATQDGDPDQRWIVIRAVTGLDDAERAAERQPHMGHKDATDGRDDRMAYAVALLRNEDVDLIADLTTPVMDGAFMVGAAYACYVLLNGGVR